MKEFAGNRKILLGKKVLFIVENLPLPFDRRVWQEANTLKNNGANVFIICPKMKGYSGSLEEIKGIKIFRHYIPKEGNGPIGYLLEYGISLLFELFLSFKIFIKFGFDIIHICNPPDLLFLVTLPYKLLGKKVIFDHHDINPELYVAKYNKKDFFYLLMLKLEYLTFKFADISIATNGSYKKIAIERGKMPETNVTVVRSGPNLDRIKLMEPIEQLKRGKRYLIGYVGVIGAQEGIDHLIDVTEILMREFKRDDFAVTICGSGPALESMIIYTKQKKLESIIEFKGRISDDHLFEILNTCDVCVNPDVWNEMNDKSTMNKIMEYMALCKPIVQYDLSEGRFSAQDASLYAKPNNREDFAAKINLLLDNKDLRERMGKFGRKRVEQKLSWQFEEKNLLKAYSKLLL